MSERDFEVGGPDFGLAYELLAQTDGKLQAAAGREGDPAGDDAWSGGSQTEATPLAQRGATSARPSLAEASGQNEPAAGGLHAKGDGAIESAAAPAGPVNPSTDQDDAARLGAASAAGESTAPSFGAFASAAAMAGDAADAPLLLDGAVARPVDAMTSPVGSQGAASFDAGALPIGAPSWADDLVEAAVGASSQTLDAQSSPATGDASKPLASSSGAATEMDFDIDAGMWGSGGPRDYDFNFDQLYLHTSGDANQPFNFSVGGSLYADVSANIGLAYSLGFGPVASLTLDSGDVAIQCDLETDDTVSIAPSVPNAYENIAASVDTAGWSVKSEGMQSTGIDLDDSGFYLGLEYDLYLELHGGVSAKAGVNIPATWISGSWPWGGGWSTEITPPISGSISGGASFDIPIINAANTEELADLSGSDLSYEYDNGLYDLTANLPAPIDQSTSAGSGPGLSALSMSQQSDTPIISLDLDAIALIASIWGIPSEVFSDSFTLFNLGFASASLDYTTISAGLNASAYYSQKFNFTPDAVQVSMTDSLGQTISGTLGQNFQFGAPLGKGNLSVNATFTLSGTLYSETDIVITASLYYKFLQIEAAGSLGVDILGFNIGASGTLGPYTLAQGQTGPLGTITIPIFTDNSHYTANSITQSYTVYYQNIPVLSESASGYTNHTSDVLTVDVSVAGVPGDAVTGVELYDGSTKLGAAAQNADGQWVYTDANLADGSTHVFQAVATDSRGNSATSAPSPEVLVVTQAPTISASETLSGVTNQTSDTFTVAAHAPAELNDAIAGVEIYDGATAIGAASYSSATGKWTFTASALPDGAHHFSAVATDLAGNTATANLAAVDVATKAPSLYASQSVYGYINQNYDTITVTTAAEDVPDDAISGVEVYDGATAIGPATFSSATGQWTYTASDLSLGVHDLSVVSTDLAGNSASFALSPIDVLMARVGTIYSFYPVIYTNGGVGPNAGLVADASGDLFGTTLEGGGSGEGGTVFEIPNTGSGYGEIINLSDFSGGDAGDRPQGGLIADAAGDLFGTATQGGAGDYGTVFEIPRTMSGYGQLSVLASFSGANGADPGALVADAYGDLFGTTNQGGPNSGGIVYGISKTASGFGPLTTLASFNSDDAFENGTPLIIDARGDLFGTMPTSGPNHDGVVYEVPNTGSGYGPVTTLAVFSGSDGAQPDAGLFADATGDLFGTTSSGGLNNSGTVFEIARTASGYGPIVTLASFDGDDGADPIASLITDAAGDLFGTTFNGGSENAGTVFEIPKTASGYDPVTVVASFTGETGYGPEGGVIADAEGDLFGTRYGASDFDDGLVFNLTDTGFIPVLIGGDAGANVVNGVAYANSALNVSTQTLTGTALAGDTVSLYSGSTLVASGIAVNAAGEWSYAIGQLADGSYSYTAKVSDATGVSPASAAFSLTVATKAPTVSASQSVAGLSNQTSDTIMVTANAEPVPDDSIAGVEIFDGAADLGAATFLNGVWSYTASNLADGAHDFSAVATDLAGNSATAALAAVDVSTQALTMSASQSVSGRTDQLSDTITVTANAEGEAGDAVASVEIYDLGKAIAAATAADGEWTFTANLSDGAHDFSVIVTDLLDLTARATLAAVDETAPGVSATESVSGLTNQTADTITVAAVAEGGSGDAIAGVEIYDEGAAVGAATLSAGVWSFTASHLTDGAHQFTAVATDSLGYSGSSAPLAALAVASQPPSISASETVSSVTNQTSDTITVSATAEAAPGDAIAGVEIFDGTVDLGAATANGDGAWSFVAGGLADGSHDLSAVATDKVGNTSKVALATVAVNTQAPTLSASQSVSGLTDDTSDTITVTASAEASTGDVIASVEIFDKGSALGAAKFANGVWTYTASNLGDGAHDFSVVATDTAGNLTDAALAEVDVATKGPAPFAAIASFSGSDGAHAVGGLIADAAGDLFGTTPAGGSGGDGAVFEIAKAASGYGPIATLYDFAGGSAGRDPVGGLVADAAGDLFGTTTQAGAGGGTVFDLPKTSAGYGAATVLASFTQASGAVPLAGLVVDANGDLFGTTEFGGADNDGAVYEIAKTGSGYGPLVTLDSFGGDDGAAPAGGLMADANGDLFGTTTKGGAHGDGALFEIAKTASGYGGVTLLASFNQTDGADPQAGVIADAAGDLYGTAQAGGANDDGVVFEAPRLANGYGPITVLASFGGANGASPEAGLIADANGDLFGTTTGGGAGGSGTVFEIPKTASGYGSLVALYSFTGGADGAAPLASLLRDGYGDLFGATTQGGGADDDGDVYEIPAAKESASGATDQTSDTISVSVSAEAVTGDAIAGVEIDDGGKALGAATLANGLWSYTASKLADGVHDFSAVATDLAGNASSFALAPVAVATKAPTLSASQSVSGITVQTSDTITVSASAEAVTGDAIAGVEIYDGAKAVGAATLSNGHWVYTASNLADGAHDFSATATDLAGNSSTLALASVTVAPSWTLPQDLAGIAYKSTYETVWKPGTGTLAIVDTANKDQTVITGVLSDAYAGDAFALSDAGAQGTQVAAVAEPWADVAAGDALVSDIPDQSYIAYESLFDAGTNFATDLIYASAAGQAYSFSGYEYAIGGEFIGSQFYYPAAKGGAYAYEEVDYDGAGRAMRFAFTGVSGAPYSSYEYDYVGGVFVGSRFTYTSVPAGAAYSSYEVDYDERSAFVGDKFSFTGITGRSYSGEEEDFDASGGLTRVLLTGVTGQAYNQLEQDYDDGTYEGYKAYFLDSGQSYTNEEIDVSAANQVEKVIYSGLTSSAYSSVEVDYAGGALSTVIYGFSRVSGETYYAYEVQENSAGAAQQETVDLNSGGHNLTALTSDQTLQSLGFDKMTGDGPTTFVLNAIYGADVITNFSSADTLLLPTQEYDELNSAIQNGSYSGGNATLSFSDGDTLTFKTMTEATLQSLTARFASH